MKATEHFQTVIQDYLEKRAAHDELFAVSLRKPGKNIKDCVTYILNTVQTSGCSGFADEEIYSMAVHYYDEDNIEIGKPIGCNVVVNHTEEKNANNSNKKPVQEPAQQSKAKNNTKKKEVASYPTLFDFF